MAFQLVVEDHSANTSAFVTKTLSGTNVCPEQLRVMREFTRLDDVGVERLASVVTRPAMILEKSSAPPCKRNHRSSLMPAAAEGRDRSDKSGRAQSVQVPAPWIGRPPALIAQVVNGNDAECPDRRKCPYLRAS